MTKSEALQEINGTIDQIAECVRMHVDDVLDASYVANGVEQWLDQLRSDIRSYDDAEEDDTEDENTEDDSERSDDTRPYYANEWIIGEDAE